MPTPTNPLRFQKGGMGCEMYRNGGNMHEEAGESPEVSGEQELLADGEG